MPDDVAERIFAKINGQYMFPESHSHAFAVTAYQAAWLKRYYPVEFFVSLVNNQPMGFYPVETLKQDARRCGVPFLNPCVNRSGVDCVPAGDAVLLGLRFVKDVGAASAPAIVEERERHGPYSGPADLVRRTGLKPQTVESLVMAGAFDSPRPQPPAGIMGRGPGHPAPTGTGSGPLPPRTRTTFLTCPISPPTRRWPASTGSWAFTPGAT